MSAPIALLDLLACPDCHGALSRTADELHCQGCGQTHPIVRGPAGSHEIPRLLPKHERDLDIEHETELLVRPEFVPCLTRLIECLASDQVVLDIGAGERETDDPRVLRLDLRFTPRVDLVGDAHYLPLQDNSVDVVLAGAVFEHLADPFAAAREIFRVLKPGGMAIADCAFVFPYHGYPASYFNASGDGMRQAFRDFREVKVEVPPWFMPAFGLQVLLGEWVRMCQPKTDNDRQFLEAVRALDRFDLNSLNECFSPEDALRIASGTAFLGLKQPGGDENVVPPPAMELWQSDAELQARFPDPAALLTTLWKDEPDSFVCWAATEGRKRSESLARWYEERTSVVKSLD